MASTYISRTNSSTSSTLTKGTFSAWVKRSAPSGEQTVFTGNNSSNTYRDFVRFEANSQLRVRAAQGAFNLETTAVYRDTNGWYHIVAEIDTTLATSTDRVKVYVNGERITAFNTPVYPTQNYDLTGWSNNTLQTVGRDGKDNNTPFDGSMTHVHWIDGTAYDADTFGETDANGVWTIKTSPSVTYGTNGFFILKDGNSVTDQSGNGNNFTVAGGTLTNTEDNPSNVFATGNPLIKGTNGNSHGNLRTTSGQLSWESMWTTLGASSGKFYAEFRRNSSSYTMFGVRKTENITTFDEITGATGGVGWQSHGSIYDNNVETESGGSPYATYADGDIIGVAMDLDNSKLYFHKNGTYQNSGVPTSGATGTGAISLTANAIYHFGFCAYNGSCDANFGNGYFGTTAVASAGTNASGIGIFEYDVPTGYTALCTKGLNGE